ncbi:MAG: DNRLRE domain-containing protein [Theionarchaea archaeon]|nr:DNRLRE domain-containing protein [Theionarchaea archaeon]
MKVWIVVVVAVLSFGAVQGSRDVYTVPRSFFVDVDGSQNCVIVVGEKADATDIVEASRLAAVIGELSSREKKIPVIEEVSVVYEDVPAGTCIVVTPLELPTLWYFDDFGVYGNGNERFELWETHEEIQLYIEDIPEFDPLVGLYRGNGYLDFSTIYRIDNVRSPPYIAVDSYTESGKGKHITGLHYQERVNYLIVDPYFVYYGYLPEISLFGELYTVVYIDTSVLITGEPYLDYVYVYKDQSFRAGEYTITLKDVDVDYNKAYLRVDGAGVREEFWMVLDPLHGFSPNVQQVGADEVISIDYNNDGIIDHFEKVLVGESELDVWGHSLFSFSRLNYGITDLIIDGIKIFIGEDIGIYLGVYWMEDVIIWGETTCCDPFVKFPQAYDFQIRPDVMTVRASQDAYVDQSVPLTNFGGLPFLSVRSFLNTNTRSFVKFDLPGLPLKALVSKATLRLTPLNPPPPRTYEVSRVNNSWGESTITWASQPGATLTGTQVTNVMEWDVTTDVQAFYSGAPNYGWRISDQSENSVVPFEILFGSRESFTRPQLIIEYTFDCNYLFETIPHVQNWINTFYDDVNNDGILDSVYEIDISLCEPIKTLCSPLFFEGPNYYYFVDFWNTSFEDGVDFRVYQTERVGSYTVEEVTISVWELIKLDIEVTEEDAQYNWILIGGMHVNVWVRKLVDLYMMPDDGSPVDWFVREAGYKMYSDPFGLGNRILVVAGKTARDTQKAIRMLIEDIRPL